MAKARAKASEVGLLTRLYTYPGTRSPRTSAYFSDDSKPNTALRYTGRPNGSSVGTGKAGPWTARVDSPRPSTSPPWELISLLLGFVSYRNVRHQSVSSSADPQLTTKNFRRTEPIDAASEFVKRQRDSTLFVDDRCGEAVVGS